MPDRETHRRRLLEIFHAGLAAVEGGRRVEAWLSGHPLAGPVWLLALGKAAAAMAEGARRVLGDAIRDGLVVTQAGAGRPLPWPVLVGGHPVPDRRSLAAGRRVLAFVDALPADARVLCLLSGGASALVEAPAQGVGLELLAALNRWILASGMDIRQANRLRASLSRIKGGRLAARLAPRPVTALALSDVPGDDPATIGSGPLTPPEDPPPPCRPGGGLAGHPVHIIGTNGDARRAMGAAAGDYRVVEHREPLTGPVEGAVQRIATALEAAPPGTLGIYGGETTVRLPARPGRGGRCQHLALGVARALAGTGGWLLLAAGSDGADGPGGDAGALVDGRTVARGEAAGLDAGASLAAADSGRFLAASGDLLHTGPTGTNVMDLVLALRWG